MSIINPAHSSVPAFLWKTIKELPRDELHSGCQLGLVASRSASVKSGGRGRRGADLPAKFRNVPIIGRSCAVDIDVPQIEYIPFQRAARTLSGAWHGSIALFPGS
jgi:hypothetical protein